jgi:membrane protein
MPQSWLHLTRDNLRQAAFVAARIVLKALRRLWGRDVMLYTGGVSFFALLAAFPALAITLGVYSLLLSPAEAAAQAAAFAQILPGNAQAIFEGELQRLVHAPPRAISGQSFVAVLIALYAAQRGIKALMAGLSFIHDEDAPQGFWGFNVMAFLILLATLTLMSVLSGVFLTVRLLAATLQLHPMRGVHWFYSEWTWASVGLSLGLTLIYRYAMSTKPVSWRASAIGGVVAAIVSLAASWGSAFYVKTFSHLGAMYGSIAAVVVLLVWLSWTVNALFFGAALATEIELIPVERPTPPDPRVKAVS